MSKTIPITKPWMDEREAEAAKRAILSGWITQGPEVTAFEGEFAAYVGSPYACAVSSCTTALHLALLAVGVKPGDEVITASHSFIATANSVRYTGALPVFVDIDPGTFNMNPVLVERAISERTRAILCVHQMGMPCDMQAIMETADRHHLPVVEDAACAVGSEILWSGTWEKIGKPQGDIACFSFHPRKLLTTGDGGMLTTANPEWDQKFRLWRQHGMSVPANVRHDAHQIIFESYLELGYNYRLTDIQAAVGREQLKRLPEIVERRRSLAARYKRLLSSVAMVCLPSEPPWARSNWQSYCIRLSAAHNQRKVMQALLGRGVATRRGIMCAHREPAYSGFADAGSLLESEKAQDQCILIPLYSQMTEEEQDYIVAQISEVLATGS